MVSDLEVSEVLALALQGAFDLGDVLGQERSQVGDGIETEEVDTEVVEEAGIGTGLRSGG